MKKIFITVGEDIIARNILATDFWPTFKEQNSSAQIVLIVRPDQQEYFRRIYGDRNVFIEAFKRDDVTWYESFVMTLARSAINSKTNLWSKMHSYERGDSGFFATYTKRVLTFIIGWSKSYKLLLRKIILRLPADKYARDIFDKHHPEILILLSLTNFDFDVPLAREAKRRSIRILGMPRSWDNFSSHGLTRVLPDVLFVQNNFLKEMLLRYQAVTEKEIKIVIVGIPHYDYYLSNKIFESKENFYKRNNLDLKKKTILYMGMGEFLFKREGDIIDILDDSIEQKDIKGPVQVLYSPHPKFRSSVERVRNMKNTVLCEKVGYLTKESKNWNEEIRNIKNFVSLIVHSDVVVMGASTNAIDAIALSKQVVCVNFDGNANTEKIPYWHSVKRFYDSYTHFESLVDTGAIFVANNREMLIQQINQALKLFGPDKKNRERLLDEFVKPFDGKSGERLAILMSKEIQKNIV